ncbi:polysaccharide pyruvyl transferase family protein [Prauserella cavernicola]|uniref:Polysaccharide pyruvyl transferase family protein n=1 Tax=Prauserella cavernicola TaxID=2800127 RepID=A0A934QM27_9PSEU|nr:polysaccharide pyruvyl transferase family protein [Prauserella cavernicola]MBK1784132.1 polysaccharide pyruvyl transferase family protein [Prauserella cavernicola]
MARTTAPRVGLFGLLGSGNVGNDGSLEVILDYLRREQPGAVLDGFCSGTTTVRRRYGLPARALHWCDTLPRPRTRAGLMTAKAFGKLLDPVRILLWVRAHDVVIVPGAGVLETTLPLHAWGFPLSLFLLTLTGRLTGTQVALVNVGGNVIKQRTTRLLISWAARLAHYRSFRDIRSRDALRKMGVDTAGDDIYPDLVFAHPEPESSAGTGTPVVGLGLMDFSGSNDERRHADAIRDTYVAAMKDFAVRLVDKGYRLRLLTGDELDRVVVDEVRAHLREQRPALPEDAVVAEASATLGELMQQIASVDVVVGTRYHNVLCGLKLAKPTISVSYSTKSDDLMAELGMAEFCQSARAVDVDRLLAQLADLERRAGELRPVLAERSRSRRERIEQQYAVLSKMLFPDGGPR